MLVVSQAKSKQAKRSDGGGIFPLQLLLFGDDVLAGAGLS